jgi:hypothetical protein
MTKDEIQHKAYEYLRCITPFKWYNLNDIPNDIIEEVWFVIERGNLDGKYNFGQHTQYENLFMKTIISKVK